MFRCHYSYSPNIFIYNTFILEHCWYQRHGVFTPGMAEFSSLRPLVLVAVVNQDVSWQLIFPCPSTCHTSFIIMFYVCIYYIMRWNYAIVVQNIINLRLWEWAEKCSVASRLGFGILKNIPGDMARNSRPNVSRRNREILLRLIFNFVVSKHE